MTPKDKARQICTDMAGGDSDFSACAEVSKYAIIAAKETIEALDEYDNNTESHFKKEYGFEIWSSEVQNMESDWRYWVQVKREIEILSEK